MGLAFGELQQDRKAKRIDERMNLGCQAAPGLSRECYT